MAGWRACDVVILASGPSLTMQDVAAVQAWRQGHETRRVMAVNTTFRAAPWCDAMYAQDHAWWQVYGEEACRDVKGWKLSGSRPPIRQDEVVEFPLSLIPRCGNSGGAAIAICAYYHVSRVVMLGFDGVITTDEKGRRKAHWHDAHPYPLGDAGSVASYAERVRRLADALPDFRPSVKVFNASRRTVYDAFPRVTLEEALA